uniref:Non-structural protein 1 n=1 Tax=Penaeus stylirostris penstyldensovirus 2 TaxID=1513228 RepID=D2WXL3_IHHNV|nr:non-structural protein 1 [Penaeus stylirostris penstyldensovirus 2]
MAKDILHTRQGEPESLSELLRERTNETHSSQGISPSLLTPGPNQEPRPTTEQLLNMSEELFQFSDEEDNSQTPPRTSTPEQTHPKVCMDNLGIREGTGNGTIQLGSESETSLGSVGNSNDRGEKRQRGITYISDTSDSSGSDDENLGTPHRNKRTRNSETTKETSGGNGRGHQESNHGSNGNRLEPTDGGESSNSGTQPDFIEGTPDGQDEMDGRRLEESEIDKQVESTTWYTFVIREKPQPRRLSGRTPNFTITDHGDHWHITYSGHPTNKTRHRATILAYLGVTFAARAEAEATTVLVRNIKRWILYLIRYGIERLSYFGLGHAIFKRIIKYFQQYTRDEDAVDGPCPYMTTTREDRAEEKPKENSAEYDYLQHLVKTKSARTVQELVNKLDDEEYKQLWTRTRGQYKDKLRGILTYYNNKKKSNQSQLSLITNLQNISKRKPDYDNMQWIKYMLANNDIRVPEILAWIIIVADKKLDKINTLVLQGPTGTGKSLTIGALLGKLNTGLVTRTGDSNTFHLQNLIGKSYALFEEPRISQITVDDFKLLFEGSDLEVNIKHQESEIMGRIPIFISTNKDIDYWVPPADGKALQTRTKTFHLTRQIKGLSDRMNSQYDINPPPDKITSDDFLGLFEEYEKEIDEIIDNYVRRFNKSKPKEKIQEGCT